MVVSVMGMFAVVQRLFKPWVVERRGTYISSARLSLAGNSYNPLKTPICEPGNQLVNLVSQTIY